MTFGNLKEEVRNRTSVSQVLWRSERSDTGRNTPLSWDCCFTHDARNLNSSHVVAHMLLCADADGTEEKKLYRMSNGLGPCDTLRHLLQLRMMHFAFSSQWMCLENHCINTGITGLNSPLCCTKNANLSMRDPRRLALRSYRLSVILLNGPSSYRARVLTPPAKMRNPIRTKQQILGGS